MPPVSISDEIGLSLADGVILCHLINQIFPRSVQSIHVPSMNMVNKDKDKNFFVYLKQYDILSKFKKKIAKVIRSQMPKEC